MASTPSAEHSHHPAVHEAAHPTARTYIWIAVVLTIITAIEVLVFYVPEIGIPMSNGLMMVVLAILAIAKFVLVVGFYMHLKFDAKLLTWLFVAGLVVAVAMITGLWAMFNGWGG